MRGVLDAIAEFRSYPLRFLEALAEGATMNRRKSSAAPGSGVPGAAAERPEAELSRRPSAPAASGHPNQHRKGNTMAAYNPLPLSAHSGHLLNEAPHVREIPGHPGRFAADFGDFNLHFTEQQWNHLDAAVRAGIAAARKASA